MAAPTQRLKNVGICHRGDIRAWINSVQTLLDEGADIHVLDTYDRGGYEGSIASAYIMSGISPYSLRIVLEFLFEHGLTPTPQVFADALFYDAKSADIIMKASNNTIDVNTLDIYGQTAHEFFLQNTLHKKYTDATKCLISHGLRTDAKIISLDDIIRIMAKSTYF